jgi:hypothetical protein
MGACVLCVPPGPILNESTAGPGRRRSCPHCNCHTRLPTANACARPGVAQADVTAFCHLSFCPGHFSGVRAIRIEVFYFLGSIDYIIRPCSDGLRMRASVGVRRCFGGLVAKIGKLAGRGLAS